MLDAASATDANRTSSTDLANAPLRRILRARPSWDLLVAAVHDLEADEQTWAKGMLTAASAVFRRGARLGCYSLEKKQEGKTTTIALGVEIEDRRERISVIPFDHDHGVAIAVRPSVHRVTLLTASFERTVEIASHERRILQRIAYHLEAAHRMRLAPETVTGFVSAEGVITPPSFGRDGWAKLLVGEATIVPQALEDGGISYVILANDAELAAARGLSEQERRAVDLAVRGETTKAISYELGVSSPLVSTMLATAASKIGAVSIKELLRVAGFFLQQGGAASVSGGEPHSQLDPASRRSRSDLTSAEKDVLDLLRRGLTNEEIAVLRGRSVRTIANQVASILRKTGHASRRGLLVTTS